MLTRHRSSRGFTLLEVITAVAVAGVVGSLAVVATADTIIDARAKAEARVVVERLRAEHRAAREQRVGLKVTTDEHTVRYQHTRGPHCTLPVGDARVFTYDAASLVISSETGACFNLRGEVDTGPATGVIITGPTGASTGTEGVVADSSTPTITVKADMSGAMSWVLPLRVDPAGIADQPAKRVSDSANLDEVIANLDVVPDPSKTLSFAPSEETTPPAAGTLTGQEITDPCLKFSPEEPLIDCTTVLTN